MPWMEPVTLRASHAALVPLARKHLAGMVEAVRDGELWKLWYTNVPPPEGMGDEIERRLALQDRGSMLPFAVLDASGACAGMTSYMNADAESRRLEIGSTWYRRRAQRTPVNTECKLLLLGQAFEALRCIAVEFRTSSFNLPSRRAIERLGAKLDGVLRSHRLHADGSLRDTCVYSITAAEWPAVRSHLEFLLRR